ncbi:FAD-binding and (Fe-S)-binding domain-containing protein [Paraglaciecola aestuariivivens]
MSQNIAQFTQAVAKHLPAKNIISQYSKRYAYGTDASFYQLTPERVLMVDNLTQIITIIKIANQFKVAITFRAAGTSLSGQAVTDSVLVVLSEHWVDYKIHQQGQKITLQTGIIGTKANQILQPYGRKIGPDPASINSCKIGGIAANNASGMCCGVEQNSYHTLADMTLVLADGSQVNTACKQSRANFLNSHKELIEGLTALSQQLHTNPELKQKVQQKYRLKNTTGYGINALIDFSDPIDMLKHLMIGSEGTLGFIADITYHTVPDHPFKSTGFFIFDQSAMACELVQALAELDVNAVELLDKRALMSVSEHEIMPKGVADFADDSVALLIDIQAADAQQLAQRVQAVEQVIAGYQAGILAQIEFATDSARNQALWNIRKGTFPAVGAVREAGTTVIIEDVAFPLPLLAKGISELHKLFREYAYEQAIIFGHALAGNLHFVFTQAFDTPEKVQKYDDFMAAVAKLVATELKGSLKAEHGTGRNMAPFVELEWGSEAYQIMKSLKRLFDPSNLLNPGVIINDDDKVHIKNLKALPSSHSIIDKCIECGFCESVCPSQGLTFTPRQRISVSRRMTQLQQQLEQAALSQEHVKQQQYSEQLAQMQADYQYLGIDSCAATGLCEMHCPVGINTGEYIKALRTEQFQQSAVKQQLAKVSAKHFAGVSRLASMGLSAVHATKTLVGDKPLELGFKGLNILSAGFVPLYFSQWPKGEAKLKTGEFGLGSAQSAAKQSVKKVVYFPACAGRIFAANSPSKQQSLAQTVVSVLNKAGFEVIIPKPSAGLCCGMAFSSKGDPAHAEQQSTQTLQVLQEHSQNGQYPIITDASSCALALKGNESGITIYESAEFVSEWVLPNLKVAEKKSQVILHVTCSSKRAKVDQQLVNIAQYCAQEVVIPADVSCCGFAGDKGFYQPELNQHALRHLKAQRPSNCDQGYSNNRSCEIGLSRHSEVPYQSILYLLDEVSQASDG